MNYKLQRDFLYLMIIKKIMLKYEIKPKNIVTYGLENIASFIKINHRKE